MEIRISNLKLKNFKGIKDLEINFEGKDTNVYGENATGKTTIFDAFKWLFFDKDSSDRKDFNIKTLDSNNNPIHFLEHEVEGNLIIDGQSVTFKKMFKEKWVKKRGQEQQEFAGHETNYWIDEVPIKKKEYEEKINSIIPENLFKLITDPIFFNNQMNWKERRELLINISKSNISDEEILNSNQNFTALRDNLNGRNIEDYKKVVTSKIKDLKEEKEKIPIRIDELTNTLIVEHEVDYDKLETEKVELNQELQNIELEMTDIQERAKENLKKADALAIAKNELNNLKFTLEIENKDKYSSKVMDLTSEKTMLENTIRNNNVEIGNRQMQVQQDQKRKQVLYKKFDEVNKLKLEFDPNSFVCPTCKREYETDRIEEMKKEFETNLNNHKESEKQAINEEGQAINARTEENNSKIKELTKDNKELEAKLTIIKNKIVEAKQNSNFDVSTMPAYQEKAKEVENIEKEVANLASADTTEIQNRKTEIKEKIDNIDKQLVRKTVDKETKERIEELKNTEEKMAQQIQEFEKQQFQIEEFTKTKVEMLENAINSNFEIVKFRLFDMQINGGLIECCDTLVNGVPYSDVNNAHKILAGLDIIKTLSKFHNATAPIFVDNAESINELCKMDAQIISLIVTTDKELRIEAM